MTYTVEVVYENPFLNVEGNAKNQENVINEMCKDHKYEFVSATIVTKEPELITYLYFKRTRYGSEDL